MLTFALCLACFSAWHLFRHLFPADRLLLWPNDLDGDGRAYGLEVAIGSDPFTPSGTGHYGLAMTSPGALTFGTNRDSFSGTSLRLMRSSNLAAGSFVEIGKVVNGTTVSTNETGDDAVLWLDLFKNYVYTAFTDANPPSPKAFYRLQSDYTPPLVP